MAMPRPRCTASPSQTALRSQLRPGLTSAGIPAIMSHTLSSPHTFYKGTEVVAPPEKFKCCLTVYFASDFWYSQICLIGNRTITVETKVEPCGLKIWRWTTQTNRWAWVREGPWEWTEATTWLSRATCLKEECLLILGATAWIRWMPWINWIPCIRWIRWIQWLRWTPCIKWIRWIPHIRWTTWLRWIPCTPPWPPWARWATMVCSSSINININRWVSSMEVALWLGTMGWEWRAPLRPAQGLTPLLTMSWVPPE